jgi:hypothetical protein
MNEKIQQWAGLLSLGIEIGQSVVSGIKALAKREGLTDEEINEAEAAAVEDSRRRAAERDAMSQPSDPSGPGGDE